MDWDHNGVLFKMQLPKPECEYGYPDNQVREIMGGRLERFNQWMEHQTKTLCPEHGVVVYPWDVERFLKGWPIID